MVSFEGKGSKTSADDYKIAEAFYKKGSGARESFTGYKTMNNMPNNWYEVQSVEFKNFKTIRPINTVLSHWNYTLKPSDKEAVLNIIGGTGVWIKHIG